MSVLPNDRNTAPLGGIVFGAEKSRSLGATGGSAQHRRCRGSSATSSRETWRGCGVFGARQALYAPRMRAVVLDQPGGPEALRPAEVPDPRPGPGEVLVRVRAS